MGKQYKIPKGAKSMSIDIAETTDKKGKKIFEISSITYYGSLEEILEIELGDPIFESGGYKCTTMSEKDLKNT